MGQGCEEMAHWKDTQMAHSMWSMKRYSAPLAIREMEIKQWNPSHLLDWLKLKIKMIPNAGDSAENLSLLPVGGGNVKWYGHLRTLAVS